MRIGLFSYPRLVHGGGFEEYLIAFAQAMRDRGHEVSVVTSSPREYRALNVALNVYYRNPLRYDNSRFTSAELRDRLSGIELHEVGMHRMRRLLSSFDVVYAKNELLDLGVLRMIRARGVTRIICGVHTPMWYPRAVTPQARLHNALYLGRVYKSLVGVVRAVHVSNANDQTLSPNGFDGLRVMSIASRARIATSASRWPKGWRRSCASCSAGGSRNRKGSTCCPICSTWLRPIRTQTRSSS
jgi:glycosyltransferase involved in cell wall biosynthesis